MGDRDAQKGGGDGASGTMLGSGFRSVRAPLVDQIGGVEAMASILVPAVEIFYLKLLGDARINEFFAGVDTERLKNKQGTLQLGLLLGLFLDCIHAIT